MPAIKCPTCNGTGIVFDIDKTHYMLLGWVENKFQGEEVKCDTCSGTGCKWKEEEDNANK